MKQLINVVIQIHKIQHHIIVQKIISIDQNLKLKHVNGIHNQQVKILIVKFIKPYMVVQQLINIQTHQHLIMINNNIQIIIIHSIRIFQQQLKHIHYIKLIQHNIIIYMDVMNLVYILYQNKVVH